jgi:hypothetical protein
MSDLSIPNSHLDLVSGRAVVVLSTLNGDSSIQSSVIWINHGEDGALGASLALRRSRVPNVTAGVGRYNLGYFYNFRSE